VTRALKAFNMSQTSCHESGWLYYSIYFLKFVLTHGFSLSRGFNKHCL